MTYNILKITCVLATSTFIGTIWHAREVSTVSGDEILSAPGKGIILGISDYSAM